MNWRAIRYLTATVLCGAFVFAPLVTVADISPGTVLTGTIDRELDSKDTQPGTTFLLHDVHSSNHDVNGGVVYGHVESVQSAGQGRPGKINLAVDKINTRAGNIYKLDGYATDVKVNTKSNAGKEAAAAAGGAIVGGLFGGWAAIAGAAGGFLVAKNSKQNVKVPNGSLVTFHITKAKRQGKAM